MGINFINLQSHLLYLVGGLEHEFWMTFHIIYIYIGNVIILTDELIFFRGVGLNHQPDDMLFSWTITDGPRYELINIHYLADLLIGWWG